MKSAISCITDFIFCEDYPVKTDIILVPGSYRRQLIDRAVELYKEGFAPYILPSGGIGKMLARAIESGEANWKSEWNFLQNIAISNGVPKNAILKEDKALNTFENAQLSWQVVQKNNIQVKKAIIVCKAFHARRALLTYQSAFSSEVDYVVCPIVDDRDITKDNWFLDEEKIQIVMGEVEKIGKYFAKYITNLNTK
jgi:uncharacterized SAM-binding protein YcdF (DUF218 family)